MNYIDSAYEDVFSAYAAEDSTPVKVHNHEMNLAWRFITSTNVSVFLTGKAGTGKTTFLRKLREMTPKRMVVLAPTGVAAINAQGQTIHSFFQLPFGPMLPDGAAANGERRSYYKMGKDKKNLIKTLDLLVIDEISMVRCDLLDAVDLELRKYRDRSKPFGGVQLLLIGDLQQLAPVAKESEWQLLSPYYSTPYFFGSRALSQIQYVTIELKHIYRQQDDTFINILAKIRSNQLDSEALATLNKRYQPAFTPPADEDWIRLTTHNRMADDYNTHMLNSLNGSDLHFHAEVTGNFPESSYPAEDDLVLRVGAQVMFLKNDPNGEFYNGKIGVVNAVNDEGIIVWSKEDKKNIIVMPMEWENTKYVIDEDTKDIKEVVEGTFKQYPLRLAWAITVHKSQGLTFDHAVLDINDSFAHGQAYVALSRCRTLEGLVLARPMDNRSVITDASVNAFIDKEAAESKQAEEHLPKMMFAYFMSLLDELFSFQGLMNDLTYLTRVVDEHLYSSQQELLTLLKEARPKMDAELIGVANKFAVQYKGMMSQSRNFASDEALQSRLHSACEYFFNKIKEIFDVVISHTSIKIGNKQVNTQYGNALDAFLLSYKVKVGTFSRLIGEPFSVKSYLASKAKAALDQVNINKDGTVSSRAASEKKTSTANTQAKEKKTKVDTKAETFRLYKQGKSIKEIAIERSMTIGTIEGHMAHLVQTGDININDVVSQRNQTLIRDTVARMAEGSTLSEMKSNLPDNISYAEIKMVIADMNKKEKNG